MSVGDEQERFPGRLEAVLELSIRRAEYEGVHLPALTKRVPGPGTPLILTVVGGEAVVEGVTIRSLSPSFDLIKAGTQYLLFLGPSEQPGPNRYGIHYGAIFEVAADQLKPLMKHADEILLGFAADESPQAFVARIQKAMQAR